MTSNFHNHHHEANRAHFHTSDWNLPGMGGQGHQHAGEHLYKRHDSESERNALVAAFPIAIVQHVTLLGKDEEEGSKTMKSDEIVTDADDVGANAGLSSASSRPHLILGTRIFASGLLSCFPTCSVRSR